MNLRNFLLSVAALSVTSIAVMPQLNAMAQSDVSPSPIKLEKPQVMEVSPPLGTFDVGRSGKREVVLNESQLRRIYKGYQNSTVEKRPLTYEQFRVGVVNDVNSATTGLGGVERRIRIIIHGDGNGGVIITIIWTRR